MIEMSTDKTSIDVQLGSLQVSIDEDRITRNAILKMAARLKAVKKASIPSLKRYPLLPDETADAYDARIIAQARIDEEEAEKARQCRREDEDNDAYLDRIMGDIEVPELDLMYELMRIIFDILDDPAKMTPEVFGELPIKKVVPFIKEVFTQAKFDVEDIFPRFQWHMFKDEQSTPVV